MDDFLAAINDFLDWEIYDTADGVSVTVQQLLLAAGLVLLGFLISSIVKGVVSRRLKSLKLQRDAIQIIERVTFWLILIVVIMTALGLLGIPLTAFAFVSGAIAIGVGFGAQNILNNFISGWILMTERPVRIGDVIEIGDDFGVVESIGGRSTRIRRVDGVHLLVPNSTLLETTVVNWTLVDRHIRTSVSVGVAYGSPVREVEALLKQAIDEKPEILDDPKPQIVFDNFGDSALEFVIYFWADVGSEKELRTIRSELRFRLTELFAEHGITIPFPQRDVHLIQPKPASAVES